MTGEFENKNGKGAANIDIVEQDFSKFLSLFFFLVGSQLFVFQALRYGFIRIHKHSHSHRDHRAQRKI